ncbi:MAG: cbb3-type cytochrome oxidase assembly protein CcoS [Desulfatitalea sp.]|nr:cbb3-type cytochrome oxidase assembly protein CcoS [Desulfatitalea sp.]MBI5897059.1 cbb3-type cytochrome oxidase assembly protein CcoS [Desulfobacterales bacterium]
MYFPYFIAYITIGLVITLILFFWALKNGQFQDQQRARFLPLRDEVGVPPAQVSRWGRLEMYALFFLAAGGLAASAAVLLVAAYFSK